MTSLYSEFVLHYTALSKSQNFRDKYKSSWDKISRLKEVDAVKSYLLDPNVGVDFLNKNISPLASTASFVVKFASIFCHQKPRIIPLDLPSPLPHGYTASCELGDLFVLFVLMDWNDKIHHATGSIFQAKLIPKIDNHTQQFLYDMAAEMEVPSYLEERAGSPGKKRSMPSFDEGRAQALRYLILNPNDGVDSIAARFSPWENDYGLRWGTFLDGLLSGTMGKPANVVSGTSSWDHLVRDLFVMVESIAKGKAKRGNNVVEAILKACFNDYTDRSHYSETLPESNFGVPIIVAIAHAPQARGN